MLDNSDMLKLAFNVGLLRRKVVEKTAKESFLAPIEVEILTFLYSCPLHRTATDIVRQRALKKNTISVHVENLVQTGFLERCEHKGDRRKVSLALSDKAKSIAARCQRDCDRLVEKLSEGLTEEELNVFNRCFEVIADNACKMLEYKETL